MKKIKRFAYAGAAILLSAGFAACSSTDDALENVNYIEKGAVKTEFNISMLGKQKTRMTDFTTQYSSSATPAVADVFRGMQDIVLIPFAKAGEIAATDNRLGTNLAVPTTLRDAGNDLNINGNNSKLYQDVEVPVGTRSFLFYGQATEQAASNPYTKEQINGVLNPAEDCFEAETPNSISFSLQPIVNSADFNATKRDALLALLNAIVTAGNSPTTDAQKWSNSACILNDLYLSFITMKAGSSENVRALVEDLYQTLLAKNDPTSTAIKTAISGATGVTVNTTTGEVTFSGNLIDYPSTDYLPAGAALLQWDTTNLKFIAATSLQYDVFNVGKLTDYVYPAALWYRTNSQIVVAEESKAAAYNAQTTWENVLKQYDDPNHTAITPEVVSTETKSVAIIKQIEYAVARLDLSILASNTNLLDKNDDSYPLQTSVTTGEGDDATTTTTNNFTITGVLIGGQRNVDYQFLPTGTDEYTIYDCHVVDNEGNAKSLSTSAVINRTLVLESGNASADEQKVNFAIEFLNNGKDFVSNNGLVPTGTKFYLIGTIDLNATSGVTKRNYVGTETAIDKVFVQDYYTTVTATATSLKNAYNVIPDLRAPKLELGLSVNVTWNPANAYSVTLQ